MPSPSVDPNWMGHKCDGLTVSQTGGIALTVRINMFRPVLTGVNHLHNALVAKVQCDDSTESEISLFFMEYGNAYGNPNPTPEQQVLTFVTALLQQCGFESYIYSSELGTAAAEDGDEVYLLSNDPSNQPDVLLSH
jgi:hypothetical protein